MTAVSRCLLLAIFCISLAGQKEVVNLADDRQQTDDPQLLELLKIRRVYVEKLSGGETAVQIRDMIIGALQSTRLFVVTENAEKADTVMKGSAEDLVFTDTFSSSEGVQARSQIGSSRTSGGSRGGLGFSVGEQESSRIVERKHEATVAVRLVNREGDVIWSTIQESLGAKFAGASADVANKVKKRLAEDVERAIALSAAYQSAGASAGKSPR